MPNNYITTVGTDMKFDVVIGNPPFKKLSDSRQATNISLWKFFLLKSDQLVKDSGIVAMVHPSGWCYPSDSAKLISKFFTLNNLVYTDISNRLQKTYFPSLWSTICYTITKKETYSGFTKFVNDEGQMFVNLNKTKLLTNNGMSIIKKITESSHQRCCFVSSKKKSMFFPGPGYIPSIDRPTTAIYKNVNFVSAKKHYEPGTDISIIYSLSPSPISSRKKVVMSYSGKPNVLIDNGNYGVGNCVVLLLNNEANLKAVESIFKSKLFRYFSLQKYSQYNEVLNLNQFPQLDMSRVWSDQEIYDEVNLSQIEIDYIESCIT